MVFDEIVLPIYDQGYLIVREAVVSLSLLVYDMLYSLLSNGLSLFFTFRFMSCPSSFIFICFAMLIFQTFIQL